MTNFSINSMKFPKNVTKIENLTVFRPFLVFFHQNLSNFHQNSTKNWFFSFSFVFVTSFYYFNWVPRTPASTSSSSCCFSNTLLYVFQLIVVVVVPKTCLSYKLLVCVCLPLLDDENFHLYLIYFLIYCLRYSKKSLKLNF